MVWTCLWDRGGVRGSGWGETVSTCAVEHTELQRGGLGTAGIRVHVQNTGCGTKYGI